MSRVADSASRKEVLTFVAESASYGNLGLFVGAGFTKAVLNDNEEVALSWGDLLQQASDKLRVDYAKIQKEGLSYPTLLVVFVRFTLSRIEARLLSRLVS